METQKVHKIAKTLLSSFIGKRIYYRLMKILYRLIPDKLYLKIMYRLRVGRKLNLENPKRFTEKMQWLKLYYRTNLMIKLADKYEVRSYVEANCGDKILIPMVGVFNSFEELPFQDLPHKFILKSTHGSGWNIICSDKTNFDYKYAKKCFNIWQNMNIYYTGRSWEYKHVPPRIICEEFISSSNTIGLDDYKIHCFNGKPYYTQYISDRYSGKPQESFYNTDWELEEFTLTYPQHDTPVSKPPKYDKMLEIAEQLSKDMPYARVDLYDCDGQIYFGEITLHPANGMDNFTPMKYDEVLGSHLTLPDKCIER